MDRSMRNDVRRSGKRAREAYCHMVWSVPKKFKDSDDDPDPLNIPVSESRNTEGDADVL